MGTPGGECHTPVSEGNKPKLNKPVWRYIPGLLLPSTTGQKPLDRIQCSTGMERGHLLSAATGGCGSENNIVCMSPLLNHGPYRKFERAILATTGRNGEVSHDNLK